MCFSAVCLFTESRRDFFLIMTNVCRATRQLHVLSDSGGALLRICSVLNLYYVCFYLEKLTKRSRRVGFSSGYNVQNAANPQILPTKKKHLTRRSPLKLFSKDSGFFKLSFLWSNLVKCFWLDSLLFLGLRRLSFCARGLTLIALPDVEWSTGWHRKLYSPHQPPIKH